MLWERDNLHAWCVAPFDAMNRGPEERAAMLARLGLRRFAFDWRPEDVPHFGASIEALERHGIRLLGWWWTWEVDDTAALETLELFRTHQVTPQLWVMQSIRELLAGRGLELPRTPAERAERVEREAARIRDIAALARPYGCEVMLYNHNGWFGILDNQLAILSKLAEWGVTDVGLVYNFSHARDELHDDTATFDELWPRIQPHVRVVNIAGTHMEDGTTLLPGQGDRERDMMRTIQDSGWTGPVGIIAESGGDAEVTLANCLRGLEWLAAELSVLGSVGDRPAGLD